MFYLTFLFKFLLQKPMRFLAFFLFGCLFVILISFYGPLEQLALNYSKTEAPGPYFFALVNSKENANWMARKLNELPGIKSIKVIDKQTLAKEMSETLLQISSAENGVEGAESLAPDYHGLKVQFNRDIGEKSQQLIRDYLVRLGGGENNVTLGKIKNQDEILKGQERVSSAIKNFLFPLSTGLLFLFWILSYLTLEKTIRQSSYIVEKFQRRRFVCFKTMGLGILLIVLVVFPILYLVKDPSWSHFSYGIISLYLVSLWGFRRNRWVD